MRTLRHQRRPSSGAETVETLGNPSRRWILRLLVRVARLREFVMSVGFTDDNLAVAIGLGKWVDCDQPLRTRAALRAAYLASERKAEPDDIPVTLRRNLDRLGALAELNEAERQIFEFVLFLGNDAGRAANQCGRNRSFCGLESESGGTVTSIHNQLSASCI